MNLKFAFLLSFMISALLNTAHAYDVIVAKDGTGKYKTLQEAIDAAPSGRTTPYNIFIKKGHYPEHLSIPAEKTFIALIGEDVASTYIEYGDGKGGTSTLTINADDCLLINLTLENTQGRLSDGPQSLAVRTNGDRAVFYNCRFISGQDTVLLNGSGKRVYFNSCYIDGNTDFIFGPAIGVFDRCIIYCRDRIDFGKGGYFTAASTPLAQPYGFVFRNCLLPDNHGVTRYTLGRPWQNDSRSETAGRTRAGNKVVFLNTKMGNSIMPAGWSAWDAGTQTDVITYAEYHTTYIDGKPADVSNRVNWSKQLSASEAKIYESNTALFGTWDPYKVWNDLPKHPVGVSLAIANMNARAVNNELFLQFNSCWPQGAVTYTLYKNGKPADKIITADSGVVAYQFKITQPDAGSADKYVIRASKDKAVLLTDTLSVTTDYILQKQSGKK